MTFYKRIAKLLITSTFKVAVFLRLSTDATVDAIKEHIPVMATHKLRNSINLFKGRAVHVCVRVMLQLRV